MESIDFKLYRDNPRNVDDQDISHIQDEEDIVQDDGSHDTAGDSENLLDRMLATYGMLSVANWIDTRSAGLFTLMDTQIKELVRECRAFVDQVPLSDWPEEFDVFEETAFVSAEGCSE